MSFPATNALSSPEHRVPDLGYEASEPAVAFADDCVVPGSGATETDLWMEAVARVGATDALVEEWSQVYRRAQATVASASIPGSETEASIDDWANRLRIEVDANAHLGTWLADCLLQGRVLGDPVGGPSRPAQVQGVGLIHAEIRIFAPTFVAPTDEGPARSFALLALFEVLWEHTLERMLDAEADDELLG